MKIGNKEIVHTTSLIIPKDEEAVIDFKVGNWEIELRLLFKIEKENTKKGIISLEVTDKIPKLILTNWFNALGMATKMPIEFGTTDNGKKLYIMICHWYIGDVNKIDLQFLLGGENGN